MADILLTHSFALKFDHKQSKLGQPWIPLGTLYAAAVLKQKGFDFAFFDFTFSNDAEDIVPVIDAEKPKLLVIYDDCFNYLSKMCLTHMREATLRMIAAGQNSGCRVIVCSADANDHHDIYLNHGADFIICGEGELTLVELAGNLLNSPETDFESIKGIAWKTNGQIRVNRSRPIITDLDSLPFPLYDLADIEKYRKIWIAKNGIFTLNMVTTRGCPYQCIWCAKPVYGNNYHSRSALNVIQEMVEIRNKFNPDKIWFADDIFGLAPGWIEEFCQLTLGMQLRIPYTIQSRVDLLTEESQVQLLAESGCAKVWLGIESGSQKILDAMHKGITLGQIHLASALIRQYGIEQAFFLQLGFPGETKKDIASTIDLITYLMPEDIGISITYPLPNTKLYDAVKHELQNKANWSDSDDLSLMFGNHFSPAFYKMLHRYIHKYFRFFQSIYFFRKALTRQPGTFQHRLKRVALMPYYLIFMILYSIKLKKLEDAGN